MAEAVTSFNCDPSVGRKLFSTHPKLSRKNSVAVGVRVTTEERSEIQSRASLLDLTTSAYLRLMALLPQKTIDELEFGEEGTRLLIFDNTTLSEMLNSLDEIGERYANIKELQTEIAQNPFMGREEERTILSEQSKQLGKIYDRLEDYEEKFDALKTSTFVKTGRR